MNELCLIHLAITADDAQDLAKRQPLQINQACCYEKKKHDD